MLQVSQDIFSAIHFLFKESHADKRTAGEVYGVGDEVLILEGPYAGIKAVATRIKTLHDSKYLYVKDCSSGRELPYPICFARQLQRQ
jgi:hypothetical protein